MFANTSHKTILTCAVTGSGAYTDRMRAVLGACRKGRGHRSHARRRRPQPAEAREILGLAPASKNAQELADALRV